jgi:hypothetical protein
MYVCTIASVSGDYLAKQHETIGLSVVMPCVSCELKLEFYIFHMRLMFQSIKLFNYIKKVNYVPLYNVATNTFV